MGFEHGVVDCLPGDAVETVAPGHEIGRQFAVLAVVSIQHRRTVSFQSLDRGGRGLIQHVVIFPVEDRKEILGDFLYPMQTPR